MVFSSVSFLFLFLPATLLVYYLVPRAGRNLCLLAASLSFYTWGAGALCILIVVSTLLDYICGWVQVKSTTDKVKRLCVVISLVGNLGLLAWFKYFNFFIDNINSALGAIGVAPFSALNIALPIGISFYTFQTISYQIDLYRGVVRHQRSLIDFALFVSLFPQLIAGPIVRYREIEDHLKERSVNLDKFAYGVTRFVIGLARKILIADSLARVVNYAFSRGPEQLPFELAWLGATAFSLQIYYDFAAYSDMAIGLGSMFGFKFPENFRFPFSARSVREFWQRWHMTLTRWFRDYFYAALKSQTPRTSVWINLNTLIVFFFVGLWHGANWTFVFWGLYQGVFLVAERTKFGKLLRALPVPARHVYTLVVVIAGSVFFRADSMEQAQLFFAAMCGLNPSAQLDGLYHFTVTREALFYMLIAALGSFPIIPWVAQRWRRITERLTIDWMKPSLRASYAVCSVIGLLLLFGFSLSTVVSESKNPFVYYQF